MYSQSYLKVLMKLTEVASSGVHVHQLNLALACHYRDNAVIITSMNRQKTSWICRAWLCRKNLHPAAGRSLVEHLSKHKTSSSALGGLQRNVSSEQALNQLCLALRGTLCWSHVGLSLIAHDRVATSKFKSWASNPSSCSTSQSEITAWLLSNISVIQHCVLKKYWHVVYGLKIAQKY